MIKNSKQVYYLCDHKKLDAEYDNSSMVVCNLSNIDFVICDFDFSNDLKNLYPNTNFIKTT